MDSGVGAQIAIGRQIGNLRVEVVAGYTKNTSDQYEAIVPPTGEIPAKGSHKMWRAMANAYYDFGTGVLSLYVGAGAGYADIKARFFAAGAPFPNETPFVIMSDHKGEFIYQAMAGAAYEI